MHDIILSNTISNYTIHHIKSSKYHKVTDSDTDWESEGKKKRIRVGVKDKMKTPEERKS